jgi:hypothetical protein
MDGCDDTNEFPIAFTPVMENLFDFVGHVIKEDSFPHPGDRWNHRDITHMVRTEAEFLDNDTAAKVIEVDVVGVDHPPNPR